MRSVLEEITKLRKGPFVIDHHNSNRYRLVVQENDGSKTGYYFSTPIYNYKTRKLVDMKFHLYDDGIYSTGSNVNIIIKENILLKGVEGSCLIELPHRSTYVSPCEVYSNDCMITPTVNGIALKYNVNKDNEKASFYLEVDQTPLSTRANNRYFALMRDDFRPLVVVSCLGSLDEATNVIAPAKIAFQKVSDKKYRIEVAATDPLAQYVLLEVNLYENKLIQDTTVESMNPTTNNAFGGVGFIGNTALCGEQWLYSKIDYSRMPEIMDKRIQKAILHIPKLDQSAVAVSAFRVPVRFCSFGSNWNNKIHGETRISDSVLSADYQSLDVISLLADPHTGMFTQSEGLILKPRIKGQGFSAISTGDNCLSPQIIEINFR